MQNRNRLKYNFYLLPPEAEAIQDKAHAMRLSFSEFVRASALGNPLPRANLIPVAQFRELAAIGNNLNQIAKKLNSNKTVFPSQLSALTKAQTLLQEVLNTLRGNIPEGEQ